MHNSVEKKGTSLFHTVALDATITLFSEACVLFSFFLFYRLLNSQLNAEAVGVYSLLRRVLALFIPVVMLGMSEGLSRYIAMANSDSEIQKTVFNSAIILIISILIITLSLHININFSSKILFGNQGYIDLVTPFSILLVGICLHTFSYSCLRGSLKIKLANLLQFLNLGVFPISILVLHRFQNIGQILISLGIVQGIIALLFAFLMHDLIKLDMKYFSPKTMKEMLVYGFPRVPAPLAGAGLISVGPIISSHFIPIVETGYLSLTLTLLVGLGGAISPLGSVLLPHVSGLIRSGNLEKLEKNLHMLVGAITQILLFVFFQFVVFSDFILRIWMGDKFIGAAPILTTVFFSLNAYGFYVVVRNIIDAVEVRPINSLNTTIALLFLIVSFLFIAKFTSHENLTLKFAAAFSISLNLLGILTYRSLRKLISYDYKKDLHHLKVSLLLNLLIISFGIIFKSYITINWFSWAMFETLLGLLYIFILWKLKFEWIDLIVGKLLPKLKLS